MSKKCLDDELYDIYIQDGKQIIECLREIYDKGVASERKKILDIFSSRPSGRATEAEMDMLLSQIYRQVCGEND